MHDLLSSVFAPSPSHPRLYIPPYPLGNSIHRRFLFTFSIGKSCSNTLSGNKPQRIEEAAMNFFDGHSRSSAPVPVTRLLFFVLAIAYFSGCASDGSSVLGGKHLGSHPRYGGVPAEGAADLFFCFFIWFAPAPAPRWILVLTPDSITSPGIQYSPLSTLVKWANREEMRRNHWR